MPHPCSCPPRPPGPEGDPPPSPRREPHFECTKGARNGAQSGTSFGPKMAFQKNATSFGAPFRTQNMTQMGPLFGPQKRPPWGPHFGLNPYQKPYQRPGRGSQGGPVSGPKMALKTAQKRATFTPRNGSKSSDFDPFSIGFFRETGTFSDPFSDRNCLVCQNLVKHQRGKTWTYSKPWKLARQCVTSRRILSLRKP